MTTPSFLQRWRAAILGQPDVAEKISDAEWLRRCAARFVQRADVEQRIADSFAEAAFENVADFGFENDPEGAADSEMSYWSE
ncbi:hypothetical protein L0Z16_03445 [Burkholderia multivorans]|uniref:hypothetical protein n=1 Tax=Burkholderia multivorans TaxID=87883 RepID=UPI002019440C|nr:hypothetical protein [Burkholderia multivorans]MCL4664449.1 hypothetical protein [Burkholderia multivorans]MCO1355843.1 hypothetical protein [Burkholderia multivorans]MCO1415973.1 hypothetical protein [Burkholderia multivorans]MCO1449915.1 hypothetical protein [Burkholderia multivorans]UQP43333.1 hypothetical protein L0Z16_03445 [Burkholderia multivorans]